MRTSRERGARSGSGTVIGSNGSGKEVRQGGGLLESSMQWGKSFASELSKGDCGADEGHRGG